MLYRCRCAAVPCLPARPLRSGLCAYLPALVAPPRSADHTRERAECMLRAGRAVRAAMVAMAAPRHCTFGTVPSASGRAPPTVGGGAVTSGATRGALARCLATKAKGGGGVGRGRGAAPILRSAPSSPVLIPPYQGAPGDTTITAATAPAATASAATATAAATAAAAADAHTPHPCTLGLPAVVDVLADDALGPAHAAVARWHGLTRALLIFYICVRLIFQVYAQLQHLLVLRYLTSVGSLNKTAEDEDDCEALPGGWCSATCTSIARRRPWPWRWGPPDNARHASAIGWCPFTQDTR